MDGSILAQMGQPDMRTPIAHALAWPQRIESGVESLNLFDIAKLEFNEPDLTRFPALRLADEAIREGGTMPAILNAANEIAVQAFLDNKIRFTDIAVIVESVMEEATVQTANSLNTILEADTWAREVAEKYMFQKRAV